MSKMVQYRRNEADTVAGYSITITTTYSSFRQEEIDAIEKWCKENVSYAILEKNATFDYGRLV